MLYLFHMKRKAFVAALSISVIALSAPSAFAWTNPSANPATGGGFVVAEQDSPANAIYIRSNGNIGIGGVTVPAEKLDVSGNIKTNGSIKIYNGATQVGEIGTTDTTWFRLNQSIAKNIYTPQYLRADGGLYVDDTSHGVNGSGILLNASLSGTYSNAVTLSSTSNSYAGSTISTTGASYLATTSGNVGVGTATANSKLTVAGLIETTTGGVKFPDGTTQITAGAGTTVSAANVSSGNFGENTGGGNYNFPGNLGIGVPSPTNRLAMGLDSSFTSGTAANISWTGAATGDGANTYGISIDMSGFTPTAGGTAAINLVPPASASGSVYAIYIPGGNWDYGIYSADTNYFTTTTYMGDTATSFDSSGNLIMPAFDATNNYIRLGTAATKIYASADATENLTLTAAGNVVLDPTSGGTLIYDSTDTLVLEIDEGV
jgi:hypothetical protein